MRAMKKAAMGAKAMKAMKAAAPKAMRAMKKGAMKRAMKAAAPKAMRAMKKAAMKRAMKAAAAPKAMRAMKKKVISARLARRHAFAGKISKTVSGLTKGDLVKNKAGRVVSKKASLRAKKSPWLAAVKQARATLKIKGFCAIKKGTPLYKMAKELYKK